MEEGVNLKKELKDLQAVAEARRGEKMTIERAEEAISELEDEKRKSEEAVTVNPNHICYVSHMSGFICS